MLISNIRSLSYNRFSLPAGYVYIGRPGPFGNPIAIGRRCSVCGETHHVAGSTLDCYKQWLWNEHLGNTDLIKKIRRELPNKILVCWCKPKPCHGDVLVKYLQWAKLID